MFDEKKKKKKHGHFWIASHQTMMVTIKNRAVDGDWVAHTARGSDKKKYRSNQKERAYFGLTQNEHESWFA